MNELQQKYIAALRANADKQTKFYWYDNGKYCAIGLLTTTVFPEILDIKSQDVFPKIFDIKPQDVSRAMEKVGMTRSSGIRIMDMNDDGKTFAEIADIIESNPKEYFDE